MLPIENDAPVYYMKGENRKSSADILLNVGFIGIHVGCLLVFLVGFSWTALAVAAALYVVRMFGLTAGYHRYFSHRSYKTSRTFQFLLGFLGTTAVQNGPLWWASHHRLHHRFSDTEDDVHSPIANTIWWSHVGWILSKKFNKTENRLVADLARFPEIRWLNRFHMAGPLTLAAALFALGVALQSFAPSLGTNGLQMLVWGFFISTTVLYHGTFTVNSIAHLFGSRRFATTDASRNNPLIALITLGEGWHNNHHRYQSSERQGFYWWEIDISHMILTALSWVGVVWELRRPPEAIYREAEEQAHLPKKFVPALARPMAAAAKQSEEAFAEQ
jgi:stearoyl-CoA desaturase (delta-9 desaturase)